MCFHMQIANERKKTTEILHCVCVSFRDVNRRTEDFCS